jgi:hypothetical protein
MPKMAVALSEASREVSTGGDFDSVPARTGRASREMTNLTPNSAVGKDLPKA